MTLEPRGILIVVGGCLILGGLVPLMLQPLLGWAGAFRYAGWCSVLVLLVAAGAHTW